MAIARDSKHLEFIQRVIAGFRKMNRGATDWRVAALEIIRWCVNAPEEWQRLWKPSANS